MSGAPDAWSSHNNLEPGKNQSRRFCLSFSRRPRWSRPRPKPRPTCLSAAQAVGAGIVPHTPPRRSARSAATCHRSHRKPTRRDSRWNLERQALGEGDKTAGGVPLTGLHSARQLRAAGGCRKWTLTALAARQLDWHGASKEARGTFLLSARGTWSLRAVPASCRCERRVIGWPPPFSMPNLQILGGRPVCSLFCHGRKGEKKPQFCHMLLGCCPPLCVCGAQSSICENWRSPFASHGGISDMRFRLPACQRRS
jgi:hypothetical protein